MDSFGIWSEKLTLLKVQSYRGTEGTEFNAISRRCRRHEERQSYSLQLLNIFIGKHFEQKVSNKIRKLSPLLSAQQCLRYFDSFVLYNPPYSQFLCVTFRQYLKLSWYPYHPYFWSPEYTPLPYLHSMNLTDEPLLFIKWLQNNY